MRLMKFFFLGILILALIIWLRLLFARKNKRIKTMNRPFPPEWGDILKENVALYRRLSDDLKGKLYGCINLFLEEKSFEGCAGLQIDDKIKLVIAALACIPLLGKKAYCYPSVSMVLVYPSAYVGEEASLLGNQLIKDEESVRLGEAWLHGTVVLSWDDVIEDAAFCDGENVVIHEFAHQIDAADGVFDFMEEASFSGRDVAHWKKLLNAEFMRLKSDARYGRRGVIDDYGAESEAEFFAVITETFFTAPLDFRDEHPELYSMLKKFYTLDPARWCPGENQEL